MIVTALPVLPPGYRVSNVEVTFPLGLCVAAHVLWPFALNPWFLSFSVSWGAPFQDGVNTVISFKGVYRGHLAVAKGTIISGTLALDTHLYSVIHSLYIVFAHALLYTPDRKPANDKTHMCVEQPPKSSLLSNGL
jgi:hypothetical protein